MITYFNRGTKKRPSFEDIAGRIIMISDGSVYGGVRGPVRVSADDGRAIIGHDIDATYNGELKRWTFSQNGEQREERTRVDKSAIRVVCDTVAEVEALMEITRVYEKNVHQQLQITKKRLAAMEGVSLVSSGPLVMVEEGNGPVWFNHLNGETVHQIIEVDWFS